MKRSDFYIKLTTAVLFIAVACYIGVYIYNALLNTFETATAIRYTVEQTFHAQGYIVRSETVLADSSLVVLPIVREGEKVASGQAVAIEYMSLDSLETANEIRTLRLMIAQLETSGGAAAAEAERLGIIMDLSKAIAHKDMSGLDELALSVNTNIFTGNPALATDLATLKARLEALEAIDSGVRIIYAPVSGTFSQIIDGFEYIEPDALNEITPTQLAELFNSPSLVTGAGKLITEFKWYYAALIDAADAMHLQEGRQISVHFTSAYYSSMDMLIEKIYKRDGDGCVILFSSNRSIQELAPYRQLDADIVSSVITGIRVPKEAIHLDDDGTTFIYMQTGVRAERVNVEILIESGDSYLVRDGAESKSPLRAGSKIIVKANNLFDGKIVG